MEENKELLVEETKELSKDSEVKEENKFEPITSQEQLNKVIKGRLDRANEKHSKELEAFSNKEKEYQKTIHDLEEKIKSNSNSEELQKKIDALTLDALKIKVANEFGLPYSMASRLQGADEKTLKEDAKAFVDAMGSRVKSAPVRNQESNQEDGVIAAFRKLNPKIKI